MQSKAEYLQHSNITPTTIFTISSDAGLSWWAISMAVEMLSHYEQLFSCFKHKSKTVKTVHFTYEPAYQVWTLPLKTQSVKIRNTVQGRDYTVFVLILILLRY